MDLAEMFDCIPNDLLITKLFGYRLSFDMVIFPNLFMKNGKL